MKHVCSLPLDALSVPLEPLPASEPHTLDDLYPIAASAADDENDAQVVRLLQETEELLHSLESASPSDSTESPGKQLDNCSTKSAPLLFPTATAPGIAESSWVLDAVALSQDLGLQTRSISGTKKSRTSSKPKTVGNVTRERLKTELAALRAQAATLESELQTAQHKRLAQWLTLATTGPPVWEQIAKRQKCGREGAEAENARLKRMLEAQTQYVTGIEESLLRLRHFVTYQQPIVSLHPSSGGVLMHQTVRIERSDEALYQILLSGLDEAYSRLDEVFHSSGIDTLSNVCPFSRTIPKTEHRNNSHLRSFVERVDVKVSPFDFDLRARVHWICSKRKNSTPNSVEYSKTAHLDDIVAGKFRARRVHNGAEVHLFILCASKRFVLKDCIVNVWRALFKSEQSSSPLFSDLYVQETGWTVAAKIDEAEMKPGCSTVEKTVSHLEPKRFSGGLDAAITTRAEADVMTNLIVESYEDDTKDLDEMMEKMLIEESFRYRK